jgi:EAL domain-containing protein (putative c-di-GMP-specific phosphodiesterase class I)
MNKRLPRPDPTVKEVAADPSMQYAGANHARYNLLLVSRSANWARAVTSATAEIGGGGISTCGARDALTRLAGVSPHYSHLLVDQRDTDGLLKELADLVGEIVDPSTDMLLLGIAETGWPRIPTIEDADTSAVREALMTTLPRNKSDKIIGPVELQAALDASMIETRYQPIIRMSDRRPIGLEALARLNHPALGTVLPDQFLPQIEQAGLASQLTELVSARVFSDLTSPVLANSGLRMSVNFPLDVMLMPAALDRLEEQRVATGIPASRFIIELTESRPVQDLVTLRRALVHLRDLGYGVAIDDVGPAVPRLAPLLELPFTSLKLDKDQVRQVIESSEVRTFLARTIADAKQHGLSVVAEGVESEEIWASIHALGADEAQGFLASRPLPVTAVPIWLEAWNTEPSDPSD